MMHPLEQMGLAQERHLELLRNAELVRQIPKTTKEPSQLRKWTGSSLIWVGGRLVNWGSGIALAQPSRRIEIAG